MKHAGTVTMIKGYEFEWSRVGGEINGMVRRPDRSLVKGLSGFYRANDPVSAAQAAEIRLAEMGEIKP